MEDLFPLALMYGMTTQEFWYEDPSLMWSYHIFYEKKQQAEFETSNVKAWLNGLYGFEALSKSLHNAFRQKGKKALNYSELPIDFNKKEVKKEDISAKAKQQFNYWAKLGERRK